MKKLIISALLFILTSAVPILAFATQFISLNVSFTPLGLVYTGATYTATLTLTSLAPVGAQLQLNGLSDKSSFPPGFSEQFSTCGNRFIHVLLGPGESCVITGTFTPTMIGANVWTLYLIAFGTSYDSNPYPTSVTVEQGPPPPPPPPVSFIVTPMVEPQNCTACTGLITPNTQQAVVPGQTALFVLQANLGFHLSNVLGSCNGTRDGMTYRTDPVTADCNVDAAFIGEYNIPTASSNPQTLVKGSDNDLWFTEANGNKIGKITVDGQITEYAIPTDDSNPQGITAGPNGNLWFTENLGNKIGEITPEGVITEYPFPFLSYTDPFAITMGADGNLWFTEPNLNQIGKMTPTGIVTEYVIPTANSNPQGITLGVDGNVWFAENASSKIAKITPAGEITEYVIPGILSEPQNVTAGPDGNIWFTMPGANKIGKITPEGAITEYDMPKSDLSPQGITAGPDGNLWFTDLGGNKIGKITVNGVVSGYDIPTEYSYPASIVTGFDGNLWFTESGGNKIGVL